MGPLIFPCRGRKAAHSIACDSRMEGWLSLVEGTRLEIERTVKGSVGSNPTPSAILSYPPQTLINSESDWDLIMTLAIVFE